MFTSKYYLPSTGLIVAVFLNNPVYAETLYKWVDKDGNITYQDQPPPEDSQLLEEKQIKRKLPVIITPSYTAPEVIEENPIIVYTIDDCTACRYMLFQLDDYKVPYQEEKITDNRDAQSLLLKELGKITAPTIAIGGNYFINLDDKELKKVLTDVGYHLYEEPKQETPEEETDDNY